MRHVAYLVAFVIVGSVAFVAVGQERTRTAAPADPVARQSEVEALRREVRELRQRVEALEAGGGKPNVAAAAAGPSPVRKGKIGLGMTLAQVQNLLGSNGELLTSTDEADVRRWRVADLGHFFSDAPKGADLFIGDFDAAGKLIAIRFARAPNYGGSKEVSPGRVDFNRR